MDYEGLYLGDKKVSKAVVSGLSTPNGGIIIEVTTDKKYLIPEVMLSKIVTEKPLDATALRDARVKVVAGQVLDILTEYDIYLSEVEYLVSVLQNSLDISYLKAEEILWKTKHKSLLDIHRVLGEEKKTLDDLLRG